MQFVWSFVCLQLFLAVEASFAYSAFRCSDTPHTPTVSKKASLVRTGLE